jgi:uncharacterized protein (TIGR02145 family)
MYDWYSAVGSVETWHAASLQGICPDGWRIPTKEEWNRLNQFPSESLLSENYWINPGTDNYGFDARPAGWYNGAHVRFEKLYSFTGWWASDEDPANNQFAEYFYFTYYCNILNEETISKGIGLSVRCVMTWDY